MPHDIELGPEQSRLLRLAIACHLGRPGSEIDPETMQRSRHGLEMPLAVLEAQSELRAARLTLDHEQFRLLLEAMLQAINELKLLALHEGAWAPGEGAGHSPNVRFEDAVARLFPRLRKDPGDAHDIAAAMMTLRRRLAAAATGTTAAPPPATSQPRTRSPRPPWWRFWSRRPGR